MVDVKTVFIVGAGASYEMGLPVGFQLKAQISDLLSIFAVERYTKVKVKDDLIDRALNFADAWREPEYTFTKTLAAASHTAQALPLTLSIDNFLHNHNGDKAVELCGKLAIVRAILAAEAKSSLYKSDTRATLNFNDCANAWLVPFMQLLSENCNLARLRERLDTIVFIVFNYDRCLEHFLMHAIRAIYRVELSLAAEMVSWIRIYHPYGTVGDLPWITERERDVETIEFGGTPKADKLLKLAQGIKTFTEGTVDDSSEIMQIRESMRNAHRFVFLGFSYHDMNMQLLLGNNPRSQFTRRVFGTAFGMSDSDARLVNEALENSLNAPSIAIRNNLTCSMIFHEFSRTLSFD